MNGYLRETDFPAVRRVMGAERDRLDDDRLEELLTEMFPGSEPEDVESFMGSLQGFAKQVAPVAQRALPGIAKGAVQGAAVGGPFGALIGAAGGVAGSVFGGGKPATSTPAVAALAPLAPAPAARPSFLPRPRASRRRRQPSSSRCSRGPRRCRRCWRLLLTGSGRTGVAVGDKQVPAAAFANAIAETAALVAEAAAPRRCRRPTTSSTTTGRRAPTSPIRARARPCSLRPRRGRRRRGVRRGMGGRGRRGDGRLRRGERGGSAGDLRSRDAGRVGRWLTSWAPQPRAPQRPGSPVTALPRELLEMLAKGDGSPSSLKQLLSLAPMSAEQHALVDLFLSLEDDEGDAATTAPVDARRHATDGRDERRIRELTQELADLREVNDTVAAALGACGACWGGDPGCPSCAGHGRAGSAAPDPALFRELVVPAIRRVSTPGREGDRAGFSAPAPTLLDSGGLSMNGEAYDDSTGFDEGLADYDESDGGGYGMSEMDEMLDGMIESDYSERKRRRGKRGGGNKPVPAARGGSAYRPPAAPGGAVSQKQLSDSLTRVAGDVKRNGEGIKALNAKVGGLTTRVDDVVAVNGIQSRELGKLDKRLRIDGALDLAESFSPGGISAFQLLRGAVKSGFLGEGKGALGNPLVIGGIGLVLNNPGILGGLLPRPQ